MFNRTTDAETFATAACALAIALFTICMGVNSTWAGPDQTPSLQRCEAVQPTQSIDRTHNPKYRIAQNDGESCSQLGKVVTYTIFTGNEENNNAIQTTVTCTCTECTDLLGGDAPCWECTET